VRASEIAAVAYGAYAGIVALAPRWGWRRRVVVWILAALMIGGPVALARFPQMFSRPETAMAMRDWAPAVYILISYYASGTLFVGPLAPFEAWLGRADACLLHGSAAAALPPLAQAIVELLYAATFLMIPTGFAILVATGFASAADRYWTTVSLAEYVSFGMLPWLPSRPPWLVDNLRPDDAHGIRRFGLIWVRRTSHRANTFPSGHTAGSLAVAFAVIPFAPLAGLGLLAIASGIAIGCISGRYHYAVDVVAGVALAVAISAAVGLAGI
jgi:membrane-associated phospholipid phosphatase